MKKYLIPVGNQSRFFALAVLFLSSMGGEGKASECCKQGVYCHHDRTNVGSLDGPFPFDYDGGCCRPVDKEINPPLVVQCTNKFAACSKGDCFIVPKESSWASAYCGKDGPPGCE